MVTSDFRPKVEIRPFCACAMTNMQYNPYLWPNCRNFRVLKEIGVEEHDSDDLRKPSITHWSRLAPVTSHLMHQT